MRTYDQTPSGDMLRNAINKYARESVDARLYRIDYVKRSKTTGNEYLVTTVGYKSGSGYITLNKSKSGHVTRYRIPNPQSANDIGDLRNNDISGSLIEAAKKEKAANAFKAGLGNVAKSLDW